MVCGFGLHASCNCMAGGIAMDICGSWVGILGDGYSFVQRLFQR
jgi:hypothetical protein